MPIPVVKTLLIFVPGILTFPGDSRNWSGRAVTFTHTRSYARAEKVEYFCGPIGRAFGQNNRCHKLYRTLDQYCSPYVQGRDDSPSPRGEGRGEGKPVSPSQQWHITLVGHSNGAAVIIGALSQFPCPRIDSLHLVCGACESSFHKNRLNYLLTRNAVKEVSVYVAKKDLALRLAHTWAGRLLGYGVLGLHGARHVLPSVKRRVREIDWPEYGHSDCWHDNNLAETLSNFMPPSSRSVLECGREERAAAFPST